MKEVRMDDHRKEPSPMNILKPKWGLGREPVIKIIQIIHFILPVLAILTFGALLSSLPCAGEGLLPQKKQTSGADKARAGARIDNPEQPAIHLVGHAHIDPVWRWTKDEGYAEVLATFRSAVARLEEYTDVAFVASSAQFYQCVKEADPALFDEVKAFIRQGRWNAVGGWWIEADTNCPLGESLVRQGLLGQRFFIENFGAAARVGFNPDVFGHPGTLPQILAGQGLSSYFFMRPGPHEKRDLRTPLFRWQGLDGTQVLGIQILGSYNATDESIEAQVRNTEQYFVQNQPDQKNWVVFYGVGDHGGGPTKAVIEKIRGIKKADARIQFSTLDRYLTTIEPVHDSLPVVEGELQHHARGCYSACAPIKAWNRESEWALLTAEKLASVDAALLGAEYPADSLRSSWERVLFNQFHDIMAGSAIEEAYRDARNDFGYALSTAREIQFKSLQAMARKIDTSSTPNARCAPFVVFSSQAWRTTVPLEVELERLGGQPPRLVRFDGQELPYQEIATAGVKVPSRIRVAFEDELPSLGYALYYLDFSRPPAATPAPGAKAENLALENDFVRVVFDEQSGAIRSCFDKTANREILRAPAQAIVLHDPDDTWGHNIISYDQEVGRFGGASSKTVEAGPDRARLQIRTSYGNSTILQDYTLYRSSPILYCRISVNWNEFYKVLKLGFPTAAVQGPLTYSVPYGFVERPMNGEEEPGQTWVDVSGRDAGGAFGLALLNDSKCGYSVKGGEIRLTVLHSTAWSHHIPQKLDESDGYRLIDTGVHEFSYALLPHTGDWRRADVARRAESFGIRPVVVLTDRHSGPWEGRREFLRISSPHVAAAALKMAEKESALVLRLVELHGRPAAGEISGPLFDTSLPFKLGPCQIKTYVLPLAKGKAPRETNLLER
jgi:alpha-mannosidase